jgi:hypothetical protein
VVLRQAFSPFYQLAEGLILREGSKKEANYQNHGDKTSSRKKKCLRERYQKLVNITNRISYSTTITFSDILSKMLQLKLLIDQTEKVSD